MNMILMSGLVFWLSVMVWFGRVVWIDVVICLSMCFFVLLSIGVVCVGRLV